MANQEAQAQIDVWEYVFGFISIRVVECAVELNIPDVLENHGGPMTLSELSSVVGCPCSSTLHRIMRFLAHKRIFKKTDQSPLSYTQTPLSRLLTRDNMGPFILLHIIPSSRHVGLTAEAIKAGRVLSSGATNDEVKWTHPESKSSRKLFTDAMACQARVTTMALIDNYPDGFKEIESLVDVGGRHGLALGMLVDAFPRIKGTTFDLPHVVATAPPRQGVEFVGGDMFESVPKADAIMLMWILHDWNDESCIEILKKCKEAIPSDTGKVMIVDAIVDEEGDGDEYTGARLALDMVMMAVTAGGKERTYKEWARIIDATGFSRHTVKNIHTIQSVIEAYP